MDLKQMGIDPREALAVGAIAQDLLKPRRVDDLEAFLARYPHITQYIEQYLGFGYASVPLDLVSELGPVAQEEKGPALAEELAPEAVSGLFATPMEEVNAEGNIEPEPGLDAELL